MSIRRRSSVAATLVGGDLSVDVLHTEDSVRLGDGTNLMGLMSLVGSVRALPMEVLQTVGVVPANLTSGTQRSKITDGTDNVEIATVGSEKALKVSVIATVGGGGGGGTSATDSAAFTAATTTFTLAGGQLDDVSSSALTEGQMGAVRLTSGRAFHVAVQNSVAVTGTFFQATQPVSGTFFQATQPVSGSFFQATQPVSLSGVATAANQVTEIAALQILDDAIIADNLAFIDGTTKLSMSGYIYDEVAGTALTENDAAAGRINLNRAQIHLIEDGVTRGRWATVNATNGLKVDGSAYTQPVSGTFFQTTQPVSSIATTAKVDVGLINAVTPLMGNGVTGTGSLRVTLASDNTAFNIIAAGNVASTAVDSGNPIKIGGKGVNIFPATLEANNDRMDAMFDLRGRIVNTPLGPRERISSQATTITASIVAATIVAAGAAGIFQDLISLVVTNSSATATLVTLISNAVTIGIYSIPANGGIVICPSTPFTQTTAATTWTLTCGTSVSSIYVVAQFVSVT